jgi:hypothetical protein
VGARHHPDVRDMDPEPPRDRREAVTAGEGRSTRTEGGAAAGVRDRVTQVAVERSRVGEVRGGLARGRKRGNRKRDESRCAGGRRGAQPRRRAPRDRAKTAGEPDAGEKRDCARPRKEVALLAGVAELAHRGDDH